MVANTTLLHDALKFTLGKFNGSPKSDDDDVKGVQLRLKSVMCDEINFLDFVNCPDTSICALDYVNCPIVSDLTSKGLMVHPHPILNNAIPALKKHIFASIRS